MFGFISLTNAHTSLDLFLELASGYIPRNRLEPELKRHHHYAKLDAVENGKCRPLPGETRAEGRPLPIARTGSLRGSQVILRELSNRAKKNKVYVLDGWRSADDTSKVYPILDV